MDCHACPIVIQSFKKKMDGGRGEASFDILRKILNKIVHGGSADRLSQM